MLQNAIKRNKKIQCIYITTINILHVFYHNVVNTLHVFYPNAINTLYAFYPMVRNVFLSNGQNMCSTVNFASIFKY